MRLSKKNIATLFLFASCDANFFSKSTIFLFSIVALLICYIFDTIIFISILPTILQRRLWRRLSLLPLWSNDELVQRHVSISRRSCKVIVQFKLISFVCWPIKSILVKRLMFQTVEDHASYLISFNQL